MATGGTPTTKGSGGFVATAAKAAQSMKPATNQKGALLVGDEASPYPPPEGGAMIPVTVTVRVPPWDTCYGCDFWEADQPRQKHFCLLFDFAELEAVKATGTSRDHDAPKATLTIKKCAACLEACREAQEARGGANGKV